MSMIDNTSIQIALAKVGAYTGKTDGAEGRMMLDAYRTVLNAAQRAGQSSYSSAWSPARVRVAVEQWVMAAAGIPIGMIDGLNGAQTQVALEKWQDHVTFVSTAPARMPPKAEAWPLQRDVEKFYGKPGTNQTRLVSPYPLFLDWDLTTRITGFQCHEKVHDSALRAMGRVLDHYGLVQIHALGLDQFGGCLNVRPMRNGTRWSMHAYGCAIDWDADRNGLRVPFARSQFGKPEYARFLDIWEAEGWVSLGRARNMDAMHLQAARL